jgi:hypothetical protein
MLPFSNRFEGIGTIYFVNGGKYDAAWKAGIAVEVRARKNQYISSDLLPWSLGKIHVQRRTCV